MHSSTPKQYLPLGKGCVIEATLATLLQLENLRGIVVALDEQDPYWAKTRYSGHALLHRVAGGAERADSVLHALTRLLEMADAADWVMVHDAARPCVRLDDIARLQHACEQHRQGAILGMPVRDTMKISDGHNRIQSTAQRENLWHAFTPQMFPLGLLAQSLAMALRSGKPVTDEASAMELAGYHPLLVQGAADNIKITNPADLALAEFYLASRPAGS
jgi:2-C-methyl-D-erythritol 4-phosphate cytidylyltransferase